MHISVKGDYALHAVFDLSLQRPGEPIKIADVARRQRIPQKFLELILSGLKQGGFVQSRRGAEGGYLLAKPADTIMVGEVLRFMEGDKSAKGGAKHRSEGPFAGLWASVDAAVSNVVDHTSFGDLARAWRERQGTYVPNWDI
jgi:Rrf2 family protein